MKHFIFIVQITMLCAVLVAEYMLWSLYIHFGFPKDPDTRFALHVAHGTLPVVALLCGFSCYKYLREQWRAYNGYDTDLNHHDY